MDSFEEFVEEKYFLPFLPDLGITSVEYIKSQTDVDQVTASLESEASRIESETKMKELLHVRENVFRTRLSSVHWGPMSTIKLKYIKLKTPADQPSDVIEPTANEVESIAVV